MYVRSRRDSIPRATVLRRDEREPFCRIPRGPSQLRPGRCSGGGGPPFIRRAGVVWIGQSVFVLPERDANELAEKLRSLGALVTMAPIGVDAIRLEEIGRAHVRGRLA